MSILSDFAEIRNFLDKFRISRAAELTLTKEMFVGFKSKDEYLEAQLQAHIESFVETASQLVEHPDHYKRNTRGITLEWLDLMKRLLVAQEGIFKIVSEQAAFDENEEIAWVLRFATYSVITLMERGKREINRQRGLLRQRRLSPLEVRERTVFMLQTISYYYLRILLTAYNVQNEKEKTTQALNVIAESLFKTKDYE